MNIALLVMMGIYTFIIIAGIHHYEAKLKKALHWLDELEEDHFETYNAYCNMSELARQYQELANKAADKAELYEEAYNSEHNAIHYELDKNEELEANNDDLREIIAQLDKDNHILEIRLKALKDENMALRNAQPIQYESSHWAGMVNNVLPAEEIPIKTILDINNQPDLFESMENFE